MRMAWLARRRVILWLAILGLVTPVGIGPTWFIWGHIGYLASEGCFGAGHWAIGQFVTGGCAPRWSMDVTSPVTWLMGLSAATATFGAVSGVLARRRPAWMRPAKVSWIVAWAVATPLLLLQFIVAPFIPGPALVAGPLSAIGLSRRRR